MTKHSDTIAKYSERLKTMKENRAQLMDKSNDAENNAMDQMIRMVAEFIGDLKVLPVPYVNPIPEGNYNDAPEGLKEISLEEWQRGMFLYCIEQSDSKQVRGDKERGHFDLRLFDVPNFDHKKLGFAVMHDWFDITTGKNRPKAITRFCRYGSDADWTSFENRFAAQFAGDNS